MSDLPHEPRVHMHGDGQFISIGFTDTQDTILKVGGHPGPGGWGDIETAREWVEAVSRRLEQVELLSGMLDSTVGERDDQNREVFRLREQIIAIREAAIRYGVNKEVGAAIAHAELVAGTRGEREDG